MPKVGGHDYYVLYFNNEGEVNKKRNKGRLAKPKDSETLYFLEDSIKKFEKKYGHKVKSIRMSQEMKDMIDGRVKGKNFLKNINLFVATNDDLGLRTIHLSELQEIV